MFRSMVDIQSAAAEISEKKKKKERNHGAKIECLHLLRRVAIITEKITTHTIQTQLYVSNKHKKLATHMCHCSTVNNNNNIQ